METKILTSQFLNLNLRDLAKGLLVAVISAVVTALYQIVSTGAFPSIQDLKSVGLVALTTGLAYLIKNFFTPTQIITTLKSVVILLLCSFMLTGCSFTQKAQSYLEKHCPKTYATNPLTGNLEIHYQCDSLWHSKQLSDKCGQVNICIDAVNGSVTGDVECIGLVNVPKLIGAAKKK